MIYSVIYSLLVLIEKFAFSSKQLKRFIISLNDLVLNKFLVNQKHVEKIIMHKNVLKTLTFGFYI